MPDRAQTPADPGTAYQLGKIEGQLREMIHNLNNEAQKNTARDEKLAKLEGVPRDIEEIKVELATLKTDKDRRDGAMGFGTALVRSPLVAWIFAAAVVAWTWIKGHGQ